MSIVELERYDHHQRGFTEVFGHGKQYQDSAANLVPHTTWLLRLKSCCTGFVTKLSSAGLVYKHYGKEIVAAAMGQPLDSPAVETTWLAVYKYFMEAVDGIDNGEPKACMYQLNFAHMFACPVTIPLCYLEADIPSSPGQQDGQRKQQLMHMYQSTHPRGLLHLAWPWHACEAAFLVAESMPPLQA